MAALVLDVVYGQEVNSMDDQYVKLTIASIEAFNESKTLGKFWVDFMPFIKYLPAWLPGASAVKYGAQWHPVTEEMIERPFRKIQSGEVGEKLSAVPTLGQCLTSPNAYLEPEFVHAKRHLKFA